MNLPQQEKALNLSQQEQALIPWHQEQAPNSLHQGQAPILPTNSSRTSVHPRTSTGYWRVETIDSANVIKQINVKVNEVNNLTVGELNIIDFDQYDAPYGDAQALLAGYCGSLQLIVICFQLVLIGGQGHQSCLRITWKTALKQY